MTKYAPQTLYERIINYLASQGIILIQMTSDDTGIIMFETNIALSLTQIAAIEAAANSVKLKVIT